MLGVSFPGRLGRRARVRASARTEGPRSYRSCVSQEGPQLQETPGGGPSALPAPPAPGLGRKPVVTTARVCVSPGGRLQEDVSFP